MLQKRWKHLEKIWFRGIPKNYYQIELILSRKFDIWRKRLFFKRFLLKIINPFFSKIFVNVVFFADLRRGDSEWMKIFSLSSNGKNGIQIIMSILQKDSMCFLFEMKSIDFFKGKSTEKDKGMSSIWFLISFFWNSREECNISHFIVWRIEWIISHAKKSLFSPIFS